MKNICPNCEGIDSLNCESCEKGIIPIRTINFIMNRMVDDGNAYKFQFEKYPFAPNLVTKTEISFNIEKSNYTVFGFEHNTHIHFPHNTVELIDFLNTKFDIDKVVRLQSENS